MTDHETLAAALVAALRDLTVVEKGRTASVKMKAGGTYSYDYADIADVVKVTRPVLAEHGIVALTPVHAFESGLACTVTLLHASGDKLDLGPFPFPRGSDAQATGSMVTYHRRYALVAALGMAAGDDDDGASATPTIDTSTATEAKVSQANADGLRAKCEEFGLSVAEVVKAGTKGRTDDPAEVLRSEVAAVKEAMDLLAPAPGEAVPA